MGFSSKGAYGFGSKKGGGGGGFSCSDLNSCENFQEVKDLAQNAYPYPSKKTGVAISFAAPAVYNTPPDPPGTGNITQDLTGAKFGTINKIYHQDATKPGYPSGWVLMGANDYVPNILNVIYAEYVNDTRIEYWITQEN